MPTDTKDIKRENFSSVEEALKGAGSRVLAHLTSRAHKLTQQEVKENDEAMNPPGAPVAYAGPYEDPEDQRNSWIYKQEAEEVPLGLTRVKEQKEEEDDDEEEDETESDRGRIRG